MTRFPRALALTSARRPPNRALTPASRTVNRAVGKDFCCSLVPQQAWELLLADSRRNGNNCMTGQLADSRPTQGFLVLVILL